MGRASQLTFEKNSRVWLGFQLSNAIQQRSSKHQEISSFVLRVEPCRPSWAFAARLVAVHICLSLSDENINFCIARTPSDLAGADVRFFCRGKRYLSITRHTVSSSQTTSLSLFLYSHSLLPVALLVSLLVAAERNKLLRVPQILIVL